ncbi:MAG: S8 family serine peptidase [Synergistaceae bacterium]|nr:S8 family serine peptidase [Synergistaceae bacterium]
MRRALNTLLIVFCAVFFAASLSYASVEPNDTFYSRQWGLKAIHAPAVWEITTGSSNIYAVVMDTGIEAGHEDIRGNFDAEHSRNFSMKMGETFANIDDIDSQDYVDTNGHGTHVAGIIAARGDNGKGIAGMSWHTKIITVKVSDTNGVVNVYRRGEIISRALEYVKDILSANPEMKIVVNMSLGWWENVSPAKASSNEYRMWQAFHDLDMTDRALICIAAGNDGENISAPTNGKYYYPVSYSGIKNMITVANAQEDDKYSRLPGEIGGGRASNWSRTSVDIAAPGTRIFSTLSRQYSDTTKEVTSHDGNNYTNKDGTSQAAPFVAGTAALLWSEYPGMTAGEVKRAIINGANSYYASDYTKYGFLDAKGAFDVMAGINVQPGVPVDDIRFPDEAFRNYILENIDRNGDSRLNADEISGITSIDISGLTVSDLEGIQYFSALEELDCSGTNIESLPGREYLPNVTAINAANCAGLGAVLFDGLDQDGAKLVSLNVSGCTSLTKIECGSNDLEALDVGGCTALEKLWCDYNKLTYLDVSGCPKLTELHCDENMLAAIDLPSNYSGTFTAKNQMHNTARLVATEDSSHPWKIDISKLIPQDRRGNISGIMISKSEATEGDSPFVGTIGYTANFDSNSGVITVGSSLVVDGKQQEAPKPASMKYDYNTGGGHVLSVVMNISDAVQEEPEEPEENTELDGNNFPDSRFLAYLQRFDTDKDGKLSEAEISAVKRIAVDGLSITSLKGIERFTSITSLICRNNHINSLNLDSNTMLEEIDCSYNSITSLKLTNHPALTVLTITSNKALKTLNLNGCSSLRELSCSECGNITTLNTDGCKSLTALDCRNNKLTALDLSSSPLLSSLRCTGNSLSSLNISNTAIADFIWDNGDLQELHAENCKSLKRIQCSNNGLETLNVKGCSSLEFLFCYYNKLNALDLSGCVALKLLECSNNSLSSVLFNDCKALEILHCQYNKLAELDISECDSLIYIECDGNSLTELDITAFTNLETVLCSYNSISELKAAGSPSLKNLNCKNNNLSVIDVSGCEKLETLRVYEYSERSNPVKNIIVDGCKSLTNIEGLSLLEGLEEFSAEGCVSLHKVTFLNGGSLLNLNLKGCTSLDTITCDGNKIESLNISGCNSLRYLYCERNNLKNLDIKNFSALVQVKCGENSLHFLDAGGCSSLYSLYCNDNSISEILLDGCARLNAIYCFSNDLNSLDTDECPSIETIDCRYNHFAYIDFGKYVGNRLYGQTLTSSGLKETGNASWPYEFDFRQIIPSDKIENIAGYPVPFTSNRVRAELKGWNNDGSEITTSYANGIAQFASRPSRLTYAYSGEYSGIMNATVYLSGINGDNPSGGNSNNTPSNNTDNPGNIDNTPGANNAPSYELAGKLRSILNTGSNTPVQNLTRNNASIYRERSNSIEYHANGSRIAAVLPEIQVSQEGIYIIPVSFDSPIPAGSYLAWHFFSDDVAQAQNDGESCVFLDADSNELAMPLTREISGVNAAAYLEADTLYAPYVSYSSAGSNNPGTSSGGGGGGCESFGFMGMILAAVMLLWRKHV